MKKKFYALFCLSLFNTAIAQNNFQSTVRYAIIVPMHDESIMLLNDMNHKSEKTIDGVHYIEGAIKNKAVIFANAGLGKANISAITARLIHDYHPEFIFLAGSAGSINPALNNQAVIIGSRIIDADLGTLTAQGPYFPNEEYFVTPQKNMPIPKSYSPTEQLLHTAQRFVDSTSQDKILLGAIATSDVLPNQTEQINLLKLNGIDVVEMEGSSFMQTCWLFNANCMVIRGVSNNADEEITQEDTIRAGNNAALLVEKIVDAL